MAQLHHSRFDRIAVVCLLASALLFACAPVPVPAKPSEAPPPPSSAPPPKAAPAADADSFLRVVGQAPFPGQAVTDQVVLLFNAPIAPLDPSAGALLSVTPELSGQVRVKGNAVVWVADEPVPAQTILAVALNPSLHSTDGTPLDPGQRRFTFAGFVFSPSSVTSLEDQDGRTMLGVFFPVPVDASGLGAHLAVRGADGGDVAVAVTGGTNPAECRVTLSENARWPVALTFKKGLPDASGLLEMQEQLTCVCPMDPFFRVTSIRWGIGDGENVPLLATFSAPVLGKDLEGAFTIADAASGTPLAFTVPAPDEPRPEQTLSFRLADVIDKRVRVHVRVGLAGAFHRTLAQEYSAELTWDRPEFALRSARLVSVGDRPNVLQLIFTAVVDPSDLGRYLTVTTVSGEDEIEFDLEGLNPGPVLAIPLEWDNPLAEATVTVGEGLPAGPARLKTAQTLQATRQLQEHGANRLSIRDTWWNGWRAREHEDGAALVVTLNYPVDVPSLREHLVFTPPLERTSVEKGYGNQYEICGDWISKQSYEMRLTPGLAYEPNPNEKQTLSEPVTHNVETEEIMSYLRFAYDDKWYFPRRSGGQLPLRTRNVREASLTVGRLFPSNVAAALSQVELSPQFEDSWCERLVAKDLTIANVPDHIVETPVDLDSLFPPDKKGVFVLTVSAKDTEETTRSTKLMLCTDMGLLAHWRDRELSVFVHQLLSLEALPAAKVTVYSSKKQVLGTASTDANGMARLGPFDAALGVPEVLVAEYNDDFTFLQLTAREESIDEFKADMPAYNRAGYDAFLYADRDLYRPGETVHARWLVRTRFSDPASAVPLLVKVVKPNGTTLFSETTTLSAHGSGERDIATEKAYPTGKYTIQLSVPGNDAAIGSYQFSLEEFVPNRIKTAVTVADTRWIAGQDYTIGVNAQHLFGAPAAARKCEAGVMLKRQPLETQQWKGFRFDNDSDFVPDRVLCGETETDADGNASFAFRYDPPEQVTFPLKAIVVGRVFELGGRSVAGKTELTLFPSEICLGVSASRNAESGELIVDAAAIRPDESPADLASVKVTLEKQSWNYYVRRYYTHQEPRWTESFEEIETKEVPLSAGRGATTFNIGAYGYYRVRVHSDQTRQFSTTSFYSYGRWFEVAESPRPSLIKISLDKQTYEVGDEATVRIESPFDGQGIVVVQGEDIQQMIPVAVKDKTGFAKFHVTEEQRPNVWIEATVIHAVEKDHTQVHPFSSFAVINLPVRDARCQLAVSFPSLPTEIRPAGKAVFAVETKSSAGAPVAAEITMAAVDEGIHGITDYRNPDPYEWLFRSRRPDLRRAHYYDKVAYDFDSPPIGGDAFFQQRVPTIDENWIRPVALWSGVVQTDANGRAEVSFDVPEYSGQLRLVAVACADTALGSAAADVFVRRPYMLRTSMPRFLLPDDACQCRAVVFNHSDAACTATLSWSASGAVKSAGGSQELAVPAHGEGNLLADFAAGGEVGQGEIKWEAVVRDPQGQEIERLNETAPLPVRAPGAFQSQMTTAVLKPGESREFRNEDFVDNALAELEITASASPLLRLQGALEYLVHYPYGCVEQTTSSLMPTYLLRKAGALAQQALAKQDSIETYLRAGIDRLFSMQTYGGGLAMWPYGEEPYPYGSVYALHFLTLVKNDRELEVPLENFKSLQKYVRGVVKDWTDVSQSSRYLRPYALYVLALDGDLEAIEQIGRFDTVTLPKTARYFLAAALAHSTQDLDRVKLYLATMPSEPYAVREVDGTLNSDIRNTAVELLVLRQTGGDPAEMSEKARELLEWIEKQRHGNTQETAFVVSALGAYLGDLADQKQAVSAEIKGPGKQGVLSGADSYRDAHTGPGGVFTVSNTGSANVYVNVTARGVPKAIDTEPVSAGGLSVARKMCTPLGELFEETTFAHAGSYVVHVQFECARGLFNVVVSDILPAGFEIENPRLDPDLLPAGKFAGNITPSYLEVRDDRLILAFDELSGGGHDYYYAVRAVTPGRFARPGIVAECMYDAEVHASGPPQTIEIK